MEIPTSQQISSGGAPSLTEPNDIGSQRSPGWRLLCVAITSSILILVLCGRFVDWNQIFVNGMKYTLNDQVGYISVARTLADTGKLESILIWPSTLAEAVTKSYPYLPGHYVVLGVVYRMFGFSAAHSFWPSLAGFLLSSVMVVWVASALFGRASALSSWAFFVFFPFNLIYAFTAMAEMTVQTSVLAAFALFLWLPPNWRVRLGPATLVLPLLFRETGIVVAVVMAGVVYKESGRRLMPLAQFCLLSIVVTVLMLASPVHTGRPFWNFGIVSSSRASGATVGDWAGAIRNNFTANSALILHPYSKPGADALQIFGLYFIASGIPLSLWLWTQKRDEVYLSMFLMLVVLLLALIGLYHLWWFRGVRHLMLTQPFVAMLWADFAQGRSRFLHAHRIFAWVSVALFMAIGIGGMYSVFRTEAQINADSERNIAFLESLGNDSRGILVSPWEFSFEYFEKHYPAKWSFVPNNDRILRLLNDKYPISTLVVRPGIDDSGLTPGAIASIGLVSQGEVIYGGQPFRVFKRSVTGPVNVAK